MEDYAQRFQDEKAKDWKSFEQCTKDITPLKEVTDNRFMIFDMNRAPSLGERIPPNYMVFFMFVHLKKFDYEYQPIEKVLWEIPFQYEEIPFYCTVEKFGYRLMSGTEDLDLIKRLLRKINSAIKIIDRMMKPLLKDVVNKGDITFENQSIFLFERYLYFKNKASELFATKNAVPGDINEAISNRNHQVKAKRDGFFNTQAMLDAYFSYQEHLLILLLPFSKFDKQKENISNIIAGNWSDKFKRVFNVHINQEAEQHYQKLRLIKEKYRNKYAHGGFEKENGSLYAKVNELGFIPVRMDAYDEFSLIPIDDINFNEICRVIGEFENYLISSEDWSGAFKLIQSGLDIYFDDKSLETYHKVVGDEKLLHEFLEHEFVMLDRQANMDW
ncbi:hypothetical protein P4647_08265 [Peribacillus frigoritolerans]|uniref:hypothetical protein n=1 Tax=Peribacillus frigoritolerans TaxID=450367 RepID=UPI002E1DE132|nr:hypothetical protein [Peribacillus frigoritolerans]